MIIKKIYSSDKKCLTSKTNMSKNKKPNSFQENPQPIKTTHNLSVRRGWCDTFWRAVTREYLQKITSVAASRTIWRDYLNNNNFQAKSQVGGVAESNFKIAEAYNEQ